MLSLTKQWFVVLLALWVGLFSLAYALPTTAMSISDADCDQLVHDSACVDAGKVKPGPHECGNDTCEISFGGQLFVAVEYSVALLSDRLFESTPQLWITGPVPSTLLRPPQTLS